MCILCGSCRLPNSPIGTSSRSLLRHKATPSSANSPLAAEAINRFACNQWADPEAHAAPPVPGTHPITHLAMTQVLLQARGDQHNLSPTGDRQQEPVHHLQECLRNVAPVRRAHRVLEHVVQPEPVGRQPQDGGLVDPPRRVGYMRYDCGQVLDGHV